MELQTRTMEDSVVTRATNVPMIVGTGETSHEARGVVTLVTHLGEADGVSVGVLVDIGELSVGVTFSAIVLLTAMAEQGGMMRDD